MESFLYADHQATVFADQLIDVAANPSSHSVMNAIIRRGIDGGIQYGAGKTSELAANILDVLKAVGGEVTPKKKPS